MAHADRAGLEVLVFRAPTRVADAVSLQAFGSSNPPGSGGNSFSGRGMAAPAWQVPRRRGTRPCGFRSSEGFRLEMFDARTTHNHTLIATYFKATGSFTRPYGSHGFAVTNERTESEGVGRSEIRDDRIARHQIFHSTTGASSLTARHGSARHSRRETGRPNAEPSRPGGYTEREEWV